MNHKQICLFALVYISFPVFSTQLPVDVSVAINNLSADKVREKAVHLAHVKAGEELPKVIMSKESIANGQYKEDISALLIGQVDVEVIKEVWDRQNNQYVLSARVNIDEEATLNLIYEYQRTASNSRRYEKLIDAINSRLNQSNITTSDFELAKLDAKAIRQSLLAVSSVQDYVKQKELALQNAAKEYTFRHLYRALEKMQLKFFDADEDKVIYRLYFPKQYFECKDPVTDFV